MTKETLQKLEVAFKLGCPDREACVFAGISPQTLYNYQEKNSEFLEQKHVWKAMPEFKARKAVIDNFDKKPELALKYLEKKLPEEFGAKSQHMISVDRTALTPADLVEQIEKRNRKIRSEGIRTLSLEKEKEWKI